ncbi:MAG: hypothetical protein JW774_01290 [Candidatus Aureabacteria bacterium]|nr:hypothetical protein [Candidatus Auribacterota bacterium]
MEKRKISYTLIILLVTILAIRVVVVRTLKPSLGLDAVYLQTVDLFSKLKSRPVPSIFNYSIDPFLDLKGWHKDLNAKDTGSGFYLFSGKMLLWERDYSVFPEGKNAVPNPLSFGRLYDSSQCDLRWPLGYGWNLFWNIELSYVNDIYVFRIPGKDLVGFKFDAKENHYIPLRNNELIYKMNVTGNSIELVDSLNQQTFFFMKSEKDPQFLLESIIHSNGIKYHLSRNKETNEVDAIMEEGTDRKTTYVYDPGTHLMTAVIFPSGYKLSMNYDPNLNLIKVENGENYQRSYAYTDSSHYHLLTGQGTEEVEMTFDYFNQQLIRIDYGEMGSVSIERDLLLGICQVRMLNGGVFKYGNLGDSLLTIEGPLDYKIRIFYDEKGLPIKLIDAQNLTMQYSWNQQGKLIQREDRKDGVETFDYDQNQHLTAYVNHLGHVTKMSYEEGLLSRFITPENEVLKFTYKGKLLESLYCETNKSTIRYQHDEKGNLSVFERENGDKFQYRYNKDGYLTEKISPNGWKESYEWRGPYLFAVYYKEMGVGKKKHEEYEYNSSGQLISKKNEKNQKTYYSYYSMNRVNAITFPTGTKRTYSWTSDGLLKTLKKENGQTISMQYDLLNRLNELSKNDAVIFRLQYDKGSGIEIKPFGDAFSSLTEPSGRKLELSYDKNYWIQEVRCSDGNNCSYEYNSDGDIISKTESSRSKIMYAYDRNRHLEAIYNNESGKVFLYQHDWRGLLRSATDESSRTSMILYDVVGRPVGIRKGLQPPFISWKWDREFNLCHIYSHQTGRGRDLSYNGKNWNVGINDSMNGMMEYGYNLDGKKESQIDLDGKMIKYDYSDYAQLKEKNLIDSKLSYNWTYDLYGRPKTFSGPGSCQYTWNDQGKLMKLTFDKKNILLLAYNEAGLLVKKTYPGLLNQLIKYDEKGNLISISENDLEPVQYEYDQIGRISQIRYPNKINTTYEYDSENRVKEITSLDGNGKLVFKRGYAYEEGNRVTEAVTERGKITLKYNSEGDLLSGSYDDNYNSFFTYTYNHHRRIESVQKKDSKGERSFRYIYDDQSGLLIKVIDNSRTDSGENKKLQMDLYGTIKDDVGFLEVNKQVVQISDKEFSIKNVLLSSGINNISIRSISPMGREHNYSFDLSYDPSAYLTNHYDKMGRLTFQSRSGRHMSYQYNDDGYLEKVIYLLDGRIHTTDYSYYPNDLLFLKDIHGPGAEFQEEKVQFVFDEQNNIIGELIYQGSGYKNLYMFSPRGEIVYRIDRGHKKYYYHLDKDGSVIGITDHLGQVVCSYSYDPFGEVMHKHETISNPFLYLGHYYDADSGFYFYKGFIGNPEQHASYFNRSDQKEYFGAPEEVFSKYFSVYFEDYPSRVTPSSFIPSTCLVSSREKIDVSPQELLKPDFWYSRVEPNFGWKSGVSSFAFSCYQRFEELSFPMNIDISIPDNEIETWKYR